MKTVFIYAGQGSQTVGMGKDFYEEYEDYRNLIDSFRIEKDFKSIMHEGPMEELTRTENTQACMAMFAAGVTELLRKHGIVPDAACGLSLGEYGALYAAGVFSAEDYVKLTAFRGAKMAEAAEGLTCCMSAVLGLDGQVVEEAVAGYEGSGYVTAANFNCPGQCVICGDVDAVAAMEEILKSKGAKRCMHLNVSGPFHTKYMQPAGEALRGCFRNMEFHKPEIPVALNYTGDFYKEGEDLKELLVAQVQNSVHMEEDFRKMIEAGAEHFIEIGPGNVLAGFLKKTARSMHASVTVTSISTAEDFRRMVETWTEK